MDTYSCPQAFTISSQQDIDASTTGLAQCTGNDVSINIISPTTDLIFPPGLLVNNISVTGLEDHLNLDLNATDLVENLYIEEFYNGSLILPVPVEPFGGAVRAVTLANSRRSQWTYDTVQVYGNGTSEWRQVNGSRLTTFQDITYLSVLQLQDTAITSPTLKSITDLESDGAVLRVPQLAYIYNATFTNFFFPTLSSLSLQVGGDLMVQHRVPLDDDDPAKDLVNSLWDVQSVDGNFAVQDWSNGTLDLSTLTTVGKQLSVRDSINTKFVFSDLSSVGNLVMENNGESLLPGDFRNLEFADSIQLKGKIDTSSFGNIFPSLKLVKQSITIEASNNDFNCSHLVFQQSQGLIGQVDCNGLDGDDSNMDPPSSATMSGISRGVWVGIGISIATAVLLNA
ncbi:hypothetical protein F5B22DRAFT_326932 [Xylaria bambusicola]|uniref:uncharacterized protein n=1 Tax=Xylaria bambusicola TaxID=326684 RepID=UPI0020086D48|nr:uncharacterized protein F5B22DRAFT_326932 [Xylaria bambusicola]KAI0509366.1 hypothetical protein F5B22DRAFT_326932 [Xylaria bambusicola]